MPTVAFWNINTGKGSPDERLATFKTWCADVKPDVLFLEEVSHTLADKLAKYTGMELIAGVYTLDKNFDPSTKQIFALQRNSTIGFVGRSARLNDYQKAKRMGIKIVNPQTKMTLWGLHANASQSGGKAAVEWAFAKVNKYPETAIGGDFNWACEDAMDIDADAVHSGLNHKLQPLKFSQFKKEYGVLMDVDSAKALDIDNNNNRGYLKYLPNKRGVIDYVIKGKGRTVLELASCNGEDAYVAILKNFDHLPVLFDIS